MARFHALFVFCSLALAFSCVQSFATTQRGQLPMSISTSNDIERAEFGKSQDGEPVELYTLSNKNGAKAKVMTYGATLTELWMPDKQGNSANIILGFDNVKQYEEKSNPHFGGTIGRFANRIANGKFQIDGATYTLPQNNGPNTLHGGPVGWDRKLWQAEPRETTEGPSVTFHYVSKDGENGFPGNVTASVTYTLTSDNALQIEYSATSDKKTPINMTNHAYFNLSGAGNGDILNHELTIFADKYTPTDDTLIPTGAVASVKGTPYDFLQSTKLGARIDQLKNGYDMNYVLSMQPRSLTLAASVHDPASGRTMQVWTTEPGIQLYTSYWLDGTLTGNGGTYKRYYAVCLEAQHFPDGINKPQFPNVVLAPGGEYKQTTTYKFVN